MHDEPQPSRHPVFSQGQYCNALRLVACQTFGVAHQLEEVHAISDVVNRQDGHVLVLQHQQICRGVMRALQKRLGKHLRETMGDKLCCLCTAHGGERLGVRRAV